VRGLVVTLAVVLVAPAAFAASSFYGDKPLPRRGGPVSISRIEPRFSSVAASLAGKPAEVRCWSKTDWARINGELIAQGRGESLDHVAGFYPGRGPRIHLEPSACAGLGALTYLRHRPAAGLERVEIALGLDTLAHESMHLRGFRNEAVTECYAVQLVYGTATKLGAPARYAGSLSRFVWTDLYRAHPAQYLSPECRNGGKLDLSPKRNSFP
jgi:hypothetical protein